MKLDSLPRMADFARVLAGVDRVRGSDGLGTYLSQGRQVAEEVIESDLVAQGVRSLAERAVSWSGIAKDLLERLKPDPEPRGWPRNPRALSGALRKVAPALREVGVEVTLPGPTTGPASSG